MTIEEARAATIELLRNDYQHAKKAVIELEVFTRGPSKKAVYQLRDVLDHIASIFIEDDPEAARSHLIEARHHLRRCVAEPIEYLAERKILEVIEARDSWPMRVPFGGNPTRSAKFLKDLSTAKQSVTDGRLAKSTDAAYRHFREAFELATALLYEVHPFQWRIRAFSFAGAGLVGLATIVGIGWGIVTYSTPSCDPPHEAPAAVIVPSSQ